MTGWQVGAARVTPIVETSVAGCIIQSGMRDATPSRLQGIPWLRPDFITDDGELRSVVQAFVIELGDAVVVVDTGIGNGKPRPGLPAWSGLDTDFLERLAGHGVKPGDVDTVVSTHLHFDHVGWNTVPLDESWVPTFPGPGTSSARRSSATGRRDPNASPRTTGPASRTRCARCSTPGCSTSSPANTGCTRASGWSRPRDTPRAT
ncbi:hypothetical protein GCM10027610_070240 [Dactylosporangium cerinum]